MGELAQEAGYPLDFSVVSRERMIQASIAVNQKSDPGYESRNKARKPSCSKCRSLVRTSAGPSRRIVCIDMQSVRLYPLSGRAP